MSNQLTTIAALPGSGSGSMSALPAEEPEAQKSHVTPWHPEVKCTDGDGWAGPFNFGGYPAIPVDESPAVRLSEVYLVGEPTPWQDTHESCEYMGGDGRMYQHMGLQKTPLTAMFDLPDGRKVLMRQGLPNVVWKIARSVHEVEEAMSVGHSVEHLGPAMWKITYVYADLLDVAGGGE